MACSETRKSLVSASARAEIASGCRSSIFNSAWSFRKAGRHFSGSCSKHKAGPCALFSKSSISLSRSICGL
jgi:hypothetical protein